MAVVLRFISRNRKTLIDFSRFLQANAAGDGVTTSGIAPTSKRRKKNSVKQQNGHSTQAKVSIL